MASTKTTPKVDGAESTPETTNDAPAAENLAEGSAATRVRLMDKEYDDAFKTLQETGRPPEGVGVKYETVSGETRPVFIKRA